MTKQNLRGIKWERFFSQAENFSAPPQIFIYMDFNFHLQLSILSLSRLNRCKEHLISFSASKLVWH